MTPVPTGFKHSDETRRQMSASRTGRTLTAEHRARIGEANRGKIRERRYEFECPCGVTFQAASPLATYCSRRCRRAARGHGRIHAPEFAHFERRCAICGTTEQLVGDHDHATGCPRGVLCRNHNLGLGYLDDDPALLRAAADYLEGNRA